MAYTEEEEQAGIELERQLVLGEIQRSVTEHLTRFLEKGPVSASELTLQMKEHVAALALASVHIEVNVATNSNEDVTGLLKVEVTPKVESDYIRYAVDVPR